MNRINVKVQLNFSQNGVSATFMDIGHTTIMRIHLNPSMFLVYNIQLNGNDSIGINTERILAMLRNASFSLGDNITVTKPYNVHEMSFGWSRNDIDYLQTVGDLEAEEQALDLPNKLTNKFKMHNTEYQSIISNMWGNRLTIQFDAASKCVKGEHLNVPLELI